MKDLIGKMVEVELCDYFAREIDRRPQVDFIVGQVKFISDAWLGIEIQFGSQDLNMTFEREDWREEGAPRYIPIRYIRSINAEACERYSFAPGRIYHLNANNDYDFTESASKSPGTLQP